MVLMGDAAHAVVPFYGQGMNCGFEDCAVLDRLLAEKPASQPLEEVFTAFAEARKPNADAIADMAVENFVEMRDKTADPHFLLEKAVEKTLLNAFPGAFHSRYSLVSFSLAPYKIAYDLGEIAGGIVRELCAGLSAPEQAARVDLARAKALIDRHLAPFLARHASHFAKEQPHGSRPQG
jgi:kynurenine 3-monooxygenase